MAKITSTFIRTYTEKEKAENIIALYRASTMSEKHLGRNWYGMANILCRNLSRQHDLAIETVAGLFSAFSPLQPLRKNIANVRTYLSGDKVSYLGIQMKKAESILSGYDPDNVLTGPKENSFYHNLLLNGMYITVDSHIFASVISIDHWKCGFASQTQES